MAVPELKSFPAWTVFLVGIMASTAATTVFAFNTFVTIRERDLLKQNYDQRMQMFEVNIKEIMTGQAEMKGQMSAIVTMLQTQNTGGKR